MFLPLRNKILKGTVQNLLLAAAANDSALGCTAENKPLDEPVA